MFQEYVLKLLLIYLVIPVITGTFYRMLPNIRVVAQHNTILRVRSHFECAVMCKREDNCVLANYGGDHFVCELMSIEGGISQFSEDSTRNWQTLGKHVGISVICIYSEFRSRYNT